MMASNQAAPATTKPLAMMTKLSQFVYFYEPKNEGLVSSTGSKAPKLIIVASWMDARDLHIAKYVSRYQALYPTAHILLLKFITKHIMSSSAGVRAMEPATSYFRSQVDSGYLSPSPEKPEILVHIFSNGGVASTKNMFDGYQKKTGLAFPLHTAVYDSCPGLYTYWGAQKAVIAGVPKGIMRWLVSPILHLLNIYLWFNAVVLRRPYNLLVNSNWHNNPGTVRQSNRTYVYGPGDELVEAKHVELHASQAAAKGYHVRKEAFEGSSHVAHVRSDEARYWKIVTETWESAISSS
ncbi:hypothetical protein BX600DRAFT_134565 [Xylariales sp. PMI_506]|nr:hypothetical protein BX600DRAFT_134565 [Xylariales sp. PMI_506]